MRLPIAVREGELEWDHIVDLACAFHIRCRRMQAQADPADMHQKDRTAMKQSLTSREPRRRGRAFRSEHRRRWDR